ncbi:Bromodomain-containing protein, partial [Ochromonadaceae sp. CCMP2298]
VFGPDYLLAVKEPIDLDRMKSKIEGSRYRSFDGFAADLELMLRNCFYFNEAGGFEFEYAEQFQFAWGLVRRNVQSVLQQDPSLAVTLPPEHVDEEDAHYGGDEGADTTNGAAAGATNGGRARATPAPAPAPMPVPAPLTLAGLPFPPHDASTYSETGSLIQLSHILTAEAIRKTVGRRSINSTVLLDVLQLVLEYFLDLDSADHVFEKPVFGPDYLLTIAEPMDLDRMRFKIESSRYKSFDGFAADLELMLRNCFYFNDPDGVEFEYAEQFQFAWGLVRRNVQSVLQQDPSLAVTLPPEHVDEEDAHYGGEDEGGGDVGVGEGADGGGGNGEIATEEQSLARVPREVKMEQRGREQAKGQGQGQEMEMEDVKKEPPVPTVVEPTVPGVPEMAIVAVAEVAVGVVGVGKGCTHRHSGQCIKLSHILTREDLLGTVEGQDLSSPAALRAILQQVWGYFSALDERKGSVFAVVCTLPDYLSHIPTPMALDLVLFKLSKKKYKSLSDFDADLALMLQNCFHYNAEQSEYYQTAEKFQYAWQLIRQNVQSVLDGGGASLLPAENTEEADVLGAGERG